MDSINKVKSISIWIFIIPFVAVNTCLILITTFHDLFPNKEDVLVGFIFPYLDGGASISRTARVFPTYLIFKPAMFLTAYLLIKYWIHNKKIVLSIYENTSMLKNSYILVSHLQFAWCSTRYFWVLNMTMIYINYLEE